MALWDIKERYDIVRSNDIRGSRACIAGGYVAPAYSNKIESFEMNSKGTSVDFGDMRSIRTTYAGTGSSSTTRGIYTGFEVPGGNSTDIDYITMATAGNASDFGDLTVARGYAGSTSNNINGITFGGNAGGVRNDIDFGTIASTGNYADFGNLTVSRDQSTGTSSPTRSLFFGGTDGASPSSAELNTIDFVTIASTGNATDFGDLTAASSYRGTASSGTRGFSCAGGIGGNGDDTIEFVIFASTGNMTDFGDLVDDTRNMASSDNSRSGFLFGGHPGMNTIQQWDLVTLGNGTDWADMSSTNTSGGAGVSESHGGISDDNLSQRPSVTYMPGSGRTLFGGGYTPSNTTMTTVEIVNALSLGNTSDFGNLTVGRNGLSGTSSLTRGLFFSGNTGSYSDVIDSVVITTTGNASDFGNLSRATQRGAAFGSVTRGIFGGGLTGSSPYTREDEIEYVTIASAGNITDFGNLTVARSALAGGSSAVRGFFGGGYPGSGYSNVIDYVTIASTGNATDFGDLSAATGTNTGAASGTRGLSAGGYSPSVTNVIDYITIASTGDASDFGDLLAATRAATGTGALTRGIFGGGYAPGIHNIIQYVTIASTGNAADFGDLSGTRGFLGMTSDSHGGLQA